MQLASVIDVASAQTSNIKTQPNSEKAFSDVMEQETAKAETDNTQEKQTIQEQQKPKCDKRLEQKTKQEEEPKNETEKTEASLLAVVGEEMMPQTIEEAPMAKIMGTQVNSDQAEEMTVVTGINQAGVSENNAASIISSFENDVVDSSKVINDFSENENASLAEGLTESQSLVAHLDNKNSQSTDTPLTQAINRQVMENQSSESENTAADFAQEDHQPLEGQARELVGMNQQDEVLTSNEISLEERIKIVEDKNNSVNPFLSKAKTLEQAMSELNNVEQLMSMGQATQAEMAHQPIDFMSETVENGATIESDNVMQQIIEKFDYIQLQESETIKVQLKPDYLGQVTINLERSNDGVTATILTSNFHVREALAGQIGQLTVNLADYGIKPNHVEVVFSGQSSDMGQEAQGESMPFNNQTGQPNQRGQWLGNGGPFEEREHDVAMSVDESLESYGYGRINRYA